MHQSDKALQDGAAKADRQVIYIITRRKKQDTRKILWGRICCSFFSMHIFTFLKRKATQEGAGLSSPAHTFRAVQVGKLTGKATIGFTTRYGPFYFNWYLSYTDYLFLQGKKTNHQNCELKLT